MFNRLERRRWLVGAVALVIALAGLLVGLGLGAGGEGAEQVVASRHRELLVLDGVRFKDLNANGVVDPYEDWRLPVSERVLDLLGKMTLAEKIAQMQHPTFIPKPDGSPPPFLEDWMTTKAIGFILVRDLPSGRVAAECMNQLQEWSELSRLGIPVVVSMDSVHGLSYVDGGMVYPHSLGLAATRDVDLVRRLAEAARDESLAIGVRMTLSPNADIATEPRWGRVMECPGEDADLAAEMVATIVKAYQNGTALNPGSVLCCVKHFPGAGPQFDGVDLAPIVSSDETLAYHLRPFQAAIDVGVASVMPYYSVPLSLDRVAALGSKATLQDLLREEMGFEGIINTDWGMVWGIQQSAGFFGGEISIDEALVIGFEDAGVDVSGGSSMRELDMTIQLAAAGQITMETIDAAVKRILTAKFEIGVFENPYVDPVVADAVVGSGEHQALSLEAAERSMTLLKNDGILPLGRDARILVAGARAEDVDSLAGGWSSKQSGPTILEALQAEITEGGRIEFEAEDPEVAAQLAAGSDVAIVVVGEPSYMHSPPWGADTLELTRVQRELLAAIDETGTPIVVVVLMGRPYILTWCAENAGALLVAYYPGTRGGVAIGNVLFGDVKPTGRLPVQLPRSMEQVLAQESDVAFDIEDPLYDYGFGIGWHD